VASEINLGVGETIQVTAVGGLYEEIEVARLQKGFIPKKNFHTP